MCDLRYSAEQLAGGVDHHQAVVVRVAGLLEERERQHDAELLRERLEPRDERVAVERMRAGEERLALRLQPVQALEELRQQHDRRAAPRPPRARARSRDRRSAPIGRHAHLDDAERPARAVMLHQCRPTGCCCVTQWNAPPPVISARAGEPDDRRGRGNSGRRMSSAAGLLASPYTGTSDAAVGDVEVRVRQRQPLAVELHAAPASGSSTIRNGAPSASRKLRSRRGSRASARVVGIRRVGARRRSRSFARPRTA